MIGKYPFSNNVLCFLPFSENIPPVQGARGSFNFHEIPLPSASDALALSLIMNHGASRAPMKRRTDATNARPSAKISRCIARVEV